MTTPELGRSRSPVLPRCRECRAADDMALTASAPACAPHRHIKYSLDFLRPLKTKEVFEAIDWLTDLLQQTWPQAGRR